jgi:hypothetical protein
MRVSDARYERDRWRLDAAVTLLGLGASTRTAARLTSLSRDRIGKLRRAYALYRPSHSRVRIARDPEAILSSRELSSAATTFVSLVYILGMRPDRGSNFSMEQVNTACLAYDAYRTLSPKGRLTFDHAYVALVAYLHGDIELVTCPACAHVFLAPQFIRSCDACGNGGNVGSPRHRSNSRTRVR